MGLALSIHAILFKEINNPVDRPPGGIMPKPIYRIYTGELPQSLLKFKKLKINDGYDGSYLTPDDSSERLPNESQYCLEDKTLDEDLKKYIPIFRKAPEYNPDNDNKYTLSIEYTYN